LIQITIPYKFPLVSKHGRSWRRRAQMAKFVFAALAVTTIIWGTTAVAARHSQPEQVTMADTGPASWSISPAQLRMW
jgi:hypothetical protein